ncbi:MAG TPA: tol-pal system protein YbgF [Rhizomicrobium sp.]|nr:tol-pal system protein YbgF [Rhizomicrobium sp.]
MGRTNAFACALFFALPLAWGTTALGANGDASATARLVADEALVQSLQARVASLQKRAQMMETADLFGPSDEEKAASEAAAQREQTQDSNIAALNQRATVIEDSIRKLTGEIEVINHRLDEMDQHIERVRKEFDYKLCTMTSQQLGAGQNGNTSLPCTPDTTAPTAAAPADNNTGVVHLAPPPGNLGTLSPDTPLPQAEAPPAAPPASAPADQTASVDPHAQFQAAMDLLARSQYDEARAAFRSFVDTNPKDPLAAQALYWLGDVAYVQKDYANAEQAFVEELKKYPQSPRSPESMLKLGQSLLAMDKKQEGCMTLTALPGRYPSASKTVISQAEALRRAGGCRH